MSAFEISHPSYGKVQVEGVEAALFEAAAETLSDNASQDITPETVALTLMGLHGVPSDGFWAAWDNEVGTLVGRFHEMQDNVNRHTERTE